MKKIFLFLTTIYFWIFSYIPYVWADRKSDNSWISTTCFETFVFFQNHPFLTIIIYFSFGILLIYVSFWAFCKINKYDKPLNDPNSSIKKEDLNDKSNL